MTPRYTRVLLKLSGEPFAGEEHGFGIDPRVVASIARQVAEASSLGVALGIVVAGDAEVDLLGIAVGVEHGDDRDPELARLAHRDLLLAGIEDVDRVR